MAALKTSETSTRNLILMRTKDSAMFVLARGICCIKISPQRRSCRAGVNALDGGAAL